MNFRMLLLVGAFAGTGVLCTRADETLTYKDLTHRLTDLERLSTLPPEGEKSAMFSSYDRASKYDAVQDKYIDWGANADGTGVIRQEGTADVMAEMKGPGCIWRIWSAGGGAGHIKIYIDGNEMPTVDMPFEHFFKNGAFAQWLNLSCYSLSTNYWDPGNNCYVPIPFQKSCKITGDAGTPRGNSETRWGLYYQFNYTQYPAGTKMPTFQWPLSPEETSALEEANTALGKCGDDPSPARSGQQTDKQDITVADSTPVTLTDLKGPQAITGLKVKLDLPADQEAQRALLRQLTIRITWDDEKTPAVWSPLGDFFGFIGGGQPYKTLPVGLKDDGTFYCYWYMPFAGHAEIELGNDSGKPVKMSWEVTHAPLDKPIAEMARFHAKWHRDAFPPERKDRAPDWTLLTTRGKGRYVGTMLHVWNPMGGWWGEGDDKFFIDGEKFPSFFGTGSEDYFGYAWCCPTYFVQPFHAQPLNQWNVGHSDDIRWHLSDNIPFQTSFEGCIEKYQPNEGGVDASSPNDPRRAYDLYAAEAYWYLAPGGTDAYGEIPVDQRIGYWKPPRDCYTEPGVIEAEWMPFVPFDWNSPSPSIVCVWDVKQLGLHWSNDKELSWSAPRPPGVDKLQLKFHVENGGKYKIVVHLTKDVHNGIFQFGVDDQTIGQPVDLYNPTLIAADPVELGTTNLAAGDHRFVVTLSGQNSTITDANKTMGFGMDYLKLVPTP